MQPGGEQNLLAVTLRFLPTKRADGTDRLPPLSTLHKLPNLEIFFATCDYYDGAKFRICLQNDETCEPCGENDGRKPMRRGDTERVELLPSSDGGVERKRTFLVTLVASDFDNQDKTWVELETLDLAKPDVLSYDDKQENWRIFFLEALGEALSYHSSNFRIPSSASVKTSNGAWVLRDLPTSSHWTCKIEQEDEKLKIFSDRFAKFVIIEFGGD